MRQNIADSGVSDVAHARLFNVYVAVCGVEIGMSHTGSDELAFNTGSVQHGSVGVPEFARIQLRQTGIFPCGFSELLEIVFAQGFIIAIGKQVAAQLTIRFQNANQFIRDCDNTAAALRLGRSYNGFKLAGLHYQFELKIFRYTVNDSK